MRGSRNDRKASSSENLSAGSVRSSRRSINSDRDEREEAEESIPLSPTIEDPFLPRDIEESKILHEVIPDSAIPINFIQPVVPENQTASPASSRDSKPVSISHSTGKASIKSPSSPLRTGPREIFGDTVDSGVAPGKPSQPHPNPNPISAARFGGRPGKWEAGKLAWESSRPGETQPGAPIGAAFIQSPVGMGNRGDGNPVETTNQNAAVAPNPVATGIGAQPAVSAFDPNPVDPNSGWRAGAIPNSGAATWDPNKESELGNKYESWVKSPKDTGTSTVNRSVNPAGAIYTNTQSAENTTGIANNISATGTAGNTTGMLPGNSAPTSIQGQVNPGQFAGNIQQNNRYPQTISEIPIG